MSRELPSSMFGKVERKSFARIKEPLEIPNLVEVQKDSYRAFIDEGIAEVFEDFSPITDYSDHFELYFLDHEVIDKPKYSEKECRDRDATYAVPLKVKVLLINKVTGLPMEHEVFMGELPKMTNNGSFIINGAERVIVSQLVRSPGVYNKFEVDKTGKKLFYTTAIPNRGAWLEYEQDASHALWVKVDRTRKLPVTVLLRALGFGTNEEILALYNNDKMIEDTLTRDATHTEKEGLFELYRRLRPGEIPNDEAVKINLRNLFFDQRRYDLAKVGRYKFDKRLKMSVRIVGCELAERVVSPDGEVLAEAGTVVSFDLAHEIQNAGVNEVFVKTKDGAHKIIANNTVSFKKVTGENPKKFGLIDTIHYPSLVFAEKIAAAAKEKPVEQVAVDYTDEINAIYYTEETVPVGEEKPEEKKNAEKRRQQRENFVVACVDFFKYLDDKSILKLTAEQKKTVKPLLEKLNHKHVTVDDIVAQISLNLDLNYGIGSVDNIDHLGNRRVRSVGELLQNQFRIGISRLERLIRERMATQDPKEVTPQALINIRPVTSAIKEFFGSSQLSQFMDQTNPIAELTHKRKLSALGPGGLNRERATYEVRDVHYTHYGRMCPIETPEGQNIGLISSLSTYAKVNEYGFIESPYRKVENGTVTDNVIYMTADEEDNYVVAQANEPLDENGHFVHERVSCRVKEEITEAPAEDIDFMDVSPKQLVSVATALIPFLETDDSHRALMGSNMQRQAVPLLKPENAIVGTGIEAKIAYDSGVMVISDADGVVMKLSHGILSQNRSK